MSGLKEILPVRQLASNIALNASKAYYLVNYAWAMSGLSPFSTRKPAGESQLKVKDSQLPIPTTAEALAAATRIAVTLLGKYGTSAKIRVDDKTGDVILTTSD